MENRRFTVGLPGTLRVLDNMFYNKLLRRYREHGNAPHEREARRANVEGRVLGVQLCGTNGDWRSVCYAIPTRHGLCALVEKIVVKLAQRLVSTKQCQLHKHGYRDKDKATPRTN